MESLLCDYHRELLRDPQIMADYIRFPTDEEFEEWLVEDPPEEVDRKHRI